MRSKRLVAESSYRSFDSEPTSASYRKLLKAARAYASEQLLIKLPRLEANALLNQGVDTFGSEDSFYSWLWSEQRWAKGLPASLVEKGELEQVLDALGRIKHSVYS